VNLDCPRMEDAAGYVLRALPDSESESYRHHVTECEDCAAKVAELGFVSHALLSAVPQLSAPPDIRGRVMSVVRAESQLLQAAGAGADRPSRSARRSLLGLSWLSLPVAGSLAVVLIVLGLGLGALLGRGSDTCASRPGSVEGAAGAKASLRVCKSGTTLALAGMQAPPAGRIYELWLDDPNDRQGPQAAGLFSVRNGKASVNVENVAKGKVVLVTDEPSPAGSDIPTRTPIVKVVA
jgi:hypothetical protein